MSRHCWRCCERTHTQTVPVCPGSPTARTQLTDGPRSASTIEIDLLFRRHWRAGRRNTTGCPLHARLASPRLHYQRARPDCCSYAEGIRSGRQNTKTQQAAGLKKTSTGNNSCRQRRDRLRVGLRLSQPHSCLRKQTTRRRKCGSRYRLLRSPPPLDMPGLLNLARNAARESSQRRSHAEARWTTNGAKTTPEKARRSNVARCAA